MKNEKLLKTLFSIVLLVIGGLIISYYWSANTVDALKKVPLAIMILCMVYVVLQILKRYLFKSENWWDWLYYIGLLSVMIPAYMTTTQNLSTFSIISSYGTIFLIIPALLDGWAVIQKK